MRTELYRATGMDAYGAPGIRQVTRLALRCEVPAVQPVNLDTVRALAPSLLHRLARITAYLLRGRTTVEIRHY